ncbi:MULTISPECIES: hypothetical protein [Morganellaceae]|uniref:Uncharacterized protein n=2 Tax=Moellerella wisconsensis TaxID=158849 RepID=A0A9Q8V5L5_9GAMM|nr:MULTISPECIES: hypothetical protein [Morganellaceae]QCJ72113.1 hypothetical protein C9446_20100 [Providencia heimbachae]UNH28991.1 hypothetical protein MNY64_17260 [Moellerella wisconsensis]UNH32449.1 hypothetical protein MNY72_17130 [Moellerella wisconsensis]UNH40887.1 hypothetical protein MNY70_16910 [Moellerella wisconsensis]UNH44227.1 hypothetical protein MNY66_15860 [Moellerella wisconsensis]
MSEINETKGYKHIQLTRRITEMSTAEDWDSARIEWSLQQVFRAQIADQCLCGHQPIIKICVIKNKTNNKTARVGNCCVNKFMSLGSNGIFNAIDRISKDGTKAASRKLLEFALAQSVISAWEFEFYLSNIDKRKLTQKQRQTREAINAKLAEMGEENRALVYGASHIEIAFEQNVINQWEKDFALRTFPMKKLTVKQHAIRANIETKMMNARIAKTLPEVSAEAQALGQISAAPFSFTRDPDLLATKLVEAQEKTYISAKEKNIFERKHNAKGFITIAERATILRVKAAVQRLLSEG